ncbi:aminopeptidase [Leeia sp.]|uniref:aminopeptidase n=1 Tax=Leeia sp. TaxID=2884678 RepID=UPI0035AD9D39
MRALLLCLSLLLSGCQTVAYYLQAAQGHADLLHRARPIEGLLADPATPATLQQQLRSAQAIRRYASVQLGLPDNASYTRYSALDRPYVLWNVVTTPPLSLLPQQHCFLFAGCVSYRGYFDAESARRVAQQAAAEGQDVFRYGVPAYSTLGWFDDPLPSTVIQYDRPTLARLIFHELAHQVVYVADDSTFNEAFATSVELEGLTRWLAIEATADERTQYLLEDSRHQAVQQLLEDGRQQLTTLYQGPLSDAEKLQQKQQIQQQMADHYQALRTRWPDYRGYAQWFQPYPNNAQLTTLATYQHWVPAFRQLFAQNGSDFPRFYSAVKALAQLPAPQRQQQLSALLPAS